MIKTRLILISFILFGLLAVAIPKEETEIYYYIDEQGDYHFSQTQRDKRYQKMRLWKHKEFVKALEAGKFDDFIEQMGRKYRLDPYLIKAVIRAESAWNPNAKSSAGAQGLMQLMPGTAKQLDCDDALDPAQNIEAGSRYLRMMLDEFKGDLVLAIAAYNAGPGAIKKYNGVPPYKETRAYVKRVMGYYREYSSKK